MNYLPCAVCSQRAALRFSPRAFLEISELDEIHAIALGARANQHQPSLRSGQRSPSSRSG
jgi:hypothetical protein